MDAIIIENDVCEMEFNPRKNGNPNTFINISFKPTHSHRIALRWVWWFIKEPSRPLFYNR